MRTSNTIIALSAFMLSAVAQAVTINNSGFEDKFNDWVDTDPSAISGDEYEGSRAAKITGSGGKFEQSVSVEANTNYTLSAYIEGDGEIGAVANGSTFYTVGGGSDYEKVSVSFDSGSATSVTIYGAYGGDEGRFDTFALEANSTTVIDDNDDDDDNDNDDNDTDNGTSISVPGIVEAEDFSDYYDTTSTNQGGHYRTDETVDIQETTDSTGGSYNVGWTADGEWLEYSIDVQSAGDYTADVRVASKKDTTKSFTLSIDGSQVGESQNVENTADWQNWVTKNVDLGSLSAGTHTLRIDISGGDFNINYIDIQQDSGDTTVDDDDTTTEAGDFDWTIWKVTLPVNGDTWYGDGNEDSAAEVAPNCTEDVFNASFSSEYFWSDTEGLHFRVPMNLDGKTPNTSYIRSELRELFGWEDNLTVTDNDCSSTSDANWSFGGDHTLAATLRMDDYNTDSTKVVLGQIHGHEISYATIKLHWEGDSKPIRVIYNETPDSPSAEDINLGYVDSSEFWTYTIKMTDTGIELSAGGVTETLTFGEELSNDWKDEDFYFKAGLYPQEEADPSSSDVYEATFSSVTITHED